MGNFLLSGTEATPVIAVALNGDYSPGGSGGAGGVSDINGASGAIIIAGANGNTATTGGGTITIHAPTGISAVNGLINAISFSGVNLTVTNVGQNILLSGNNTSGFVNGPASATDQTVAIFNGTTGKLIADATTLVYNSSLKSFSEGDSSIASGSDSHAEGNGTTASGFASHSEGQSSIAKGGGAGAHAEGYNTISAGNGSHAEGYATFAATDFSHAEGSNTIASGSAAHAEGHGSWALGDVSHAEGESNVAQGTNSHAEGNGTQAIGTNSHAQGSQTVASGNASFAAGINAIAIHNGSIVFNDNQGLVTPIYSTAVGEFTIAQSGGIRLISGTSMFPEISGLNTVGTSNKPFSGVYAAQFYGQPILYSPNGTRYGIVVSNVGVVTATAF